MSAGSEQRAAGFRRCVTLLLPALQATESNALPAQDKGQQHLKALPLVMRRARLLLQLGQEVRKQSHNDCSQSHKL